MEGQNISNPIQDIQIISNSSLYVPLIKKETICDPFKKYFPVKNESINPTKEEKLFKKRLKYLYKKIDSISTLLWSHDNHITGKRLRSEIGSEDNQTKWKNKETTQTGYGEIAMVK